MKIRIDFRRCSLLAKRWNDAQKARIIHKLGGRTENEFQDRLRQGIDLGVNQKFSKYEATLQKLFDTYGEIIYERDAIRLCIDVNRHMLLQVGSTSEAQALATLSSQTISKQIYELGLAGLVYKGKEKLFRGPF